MRYIFKFPDIGEGLEEGKIIQWYVRKGQSIASGDPLVKMETDKVVTDIPSPKSGAIVQLYGTVGDTIHVGSALVELEIEGVSPEDAQDIAQSKPQAPSTDRVEEKGFGVVGTIEVAGDAAYLPSSGEGISSSQEMAETPLRKVLATPVARAMAKELGIDINRIKGSGPAGRVTKTDIERFHTSPSTARGSSPTQVNLMTIAPDAAQEKARITSQPLSTIRKTIARNMARAHQNTVPMAVMDEIGIDALYAARLRLKAIYQSQGVQISYLPFVIKAVSLGLKHHSVLNAELDLENDSILYKNYYNIGIAVDTEDGLVVPVIRNTDEKSIISIAKELNDFSIRARERKLTLEDMKDGTFTITSYGSIGGLFAVPVINYPQVAILGVGKVVEKPVVKDTQIVIGQVMPVSLAVDHRIVDGGEVARFLNRVMQYLADPILMLAETGGKDGI